MTGVVLENPFTRNATSSRDATFVGDRGLAAEEILGSVKLQEFFHKIKRCLENLESSLRVLATDTTPVLVLLLPPSPNISLDLIELFSAESTAAFTSRQLWLPAESSAP
jgi:hypothetical protein